MKEIKIQLNQDLVNMLQALHFEVETRTNIVKFMLSNPNQKINKELFDSYNQELSEYTAEYSLLKEEVNSLIPSYLKSHNITWTIDFKMCVLIISIHCDCKIEGYND